MKIAAVIAEYNPFHSGHAYQLKEIRQSLGADYIIIVMSGDFVQRGEPALFPKHLRAKAALECGTDLVLELPCAFASASAEVFARGAVGLLHKLGLVDMLCFGCEDAFTDQIETLARLFAQEPASFQEKLHRHLSSGLSFPKAREEAAVSYLQESAPYGSRASISREKIQSILRKPNNILAIEYCKALIRCHSSIIPTAMPRIGSAYLDDRLEGTGENVFQKESHFASALALRKALLQEQSPEDVLAKWNPFLPPKAYLLFQNAIRQGAWLSSQDLDLLLRYRLLSETADSLKEYQDMAPSLAGRIMAMRNSCFGFDSFAESLKTKEITLSRVRRCLLHILLGLKDKEYRIEYARILGLRKDSSLLLRQIKACSSIPLADKPSASMECQNDKESILASNLYQTLLSHKSGQAYRHDLALSPVIV